MALVQKINGLNRINNSQVNIQSKRYILPLPQWYNSKENNIIYKDNKKIKMDVIKFKSDSDHDKFVSYKRTKVLYYKKIYQNKKEQSKKNYLLFTQKRHFLQNPIVSIDNDILFYLERDVEFLKHITNIRVSENYIKLNETRNDRISNFFIKKNNSHFPKFFSPLDIYRIDLSKNIKYILINDKYYYREHINIGLSTYKSTCISKNFLGNVILLDLILKIKSNDNLSKIEKEYCDIFLYKINLDNLYKKLLCMSDYRILIFSCRLFRSIILYNGSVDLEDIINGVNLYQKYKDSEYKKVY